MRSRWIAVSLLSIVEVAACSTGPRAVPLKPPNTELIVGEYERHPPDGETAARFRADGSVRIARSRALLDSEPPLASGTWKIDGNKLTLSYDQGMCTEQPREKVGIYNVVISKIGIRFVRLDDPCERRSAIDGQTWWRIK